MAWYAKMAVIGSVLLIAGVIVGIDAPILRMAMVGIATTILIIAAVGWLAD